MVKVYIVGAGPGKPDLISVRGLNILKQAEVVIYDYLVDKKLLEAVPAEAELICADELGKFRYTNGFADAQKKINDLLVKKAKAGKRVVRLKNGDPSIFGRLSQELEALIKHKIEYEIVPGITAASAAAAYGGIPLTDRRYSSSLIFVTGHEATGKKTSLIDWGKIASMTTIVLYMAVENLSQIAKKLIAEGKDRETPAFVISRAGEMAQKTAGGNLSGIAEVAKKSGISAPAIVIIGEVAGLGTEFDWFGKNRRILYTGLSDERYFLKGTYFHLPLIEIKPAVNYRKFDRAVKNIGSFDWIVFSSRYGVDYFFERLAFSGQDARSLAGLKIAAVGGSTARKLLEYGILADLVPKFERAAGLLKAFRKINLSGVKMLLPRSDIADKGLNVGLEKLGAEVTSIVAYKNVIPEDLPNLDLNFFDEIYFTSPSTVMNFKKRYKRIPRGVKVKWIGDVTRKEVRRQFKHAAV